MNEEYIEYPVNFNFGYDPTQTEEIPMSTLVAETELPSNFTINTNYLPPVGSQGQSPSCAAWASVYGATTFWAASNAGISPTDASNQASPAFIYIKVMQLMGVADNNCTGSSIGSYFKVIVQDAGTPNLNNAPFTNGAPMGKAECGFLWSNYATGEPTIESQFNVPKIQGISTRDANQVKQVLSMGYPIAYGTSLYDDFTKYKGANLPIPYVGDGGIVPHEGHCMLIIGYDDNCGPNGAFLIQNSWTNTWGTGINSSSTSAGFVWMDYITFSKLVQGQGVYIPNPS